MHAILAHGRGGEQLGPTGCFIGASIFALASLWFLGGALYPKWRASARWGKGGRGGPMSALGCAAWAFNAFVWSVALLAQGAQYSPIVRVTGWLLGGGFAIVITAAVRDGYHRDDTSAQTPNQAQRTSSVRFKLWITAATLKWIVLLIAIPFLNGFPPPGWVSVCGLVFMFGHFATECFFPGGMHALEKVSRQPYHYRLSNFILVPGAIGVVLLLIISFTVRREWLPLTEMRLGIVLGLDLVGLWGLAYVAHRDFLMARYWSHKSSEAQCIINSRIIQIKGLIEAPWTDENRQKLVYFWSERRFRFVDTSIVPLVARRGHILWNLISYDMMRLRADLSISSSKPSHIDLLLTVHTTFQQITECNRAFWDLEMATCESFLIRGDKRETEWVEFMRAHRKAAIIWTLTMGVGGQRIHQKKDQA